MEQGSARGVYLLPHPYAAEPMLIMYTFKVQITSMGSAAENWENLSLKDKLQK